MHKKKRGPRTDRKEIRSLSEKEGRGREIVLGSRRKRREKKETVNTYTGTT